MNARHLKRAKSNDQYEKLQEVNNNDIRFFFSYLGFLSQTFTNHRTAGELTSAHS